MKKRDQDYVFPSTSSESGHMEVVRKSFASACKRACIEGLRFHDLRHTAATRMIENGANIVAVKEILGHSNLEMTMRYSHPNDSLKDAVETLSKNKIHELEHQIK
jgi:integrase